MSFFQQVKFPVLVFCFNLFIQQAGQWECGKSGCFFGLPFQAAAASDAFFLSLSVAATAASGA